MARRPASSIDEKNLTKGQLRKLNALRKSLGERIADKAFAEWLAKQRSGSEETPDRNAQRIAEALQPLVKQGRLRIRRGGYLVRRGRGRVIVEAPNEPAAPAKAPRNRGK